MKEVPFQRKIVHRERGLASGWILTVSNIVNYPLLPTPPPPKHTPRAAMPCVLNFDFKKKNYLKQFNEGLLFEQMPLF